LIAAGLLVLLPTVAAATDCPPGGPVTASYALAWRSLPAPPPVGQPFAIEVTVCPRAGAALPDSLAVDAQMPAHRHGMNYRPSIRQEAPGRYRAEGLLFHMPGAWQLDFALRSGARTERTSAAIEVE